MQVGHGGRATAEAFGRRPLAFGAVVQTQATLCVISSGQSGVWTGISSSPLVFSCQYLSTNAITDAI